MNYIKKHFEIIIGYVLFAIFTGLGTFILIKGHQIMHFKDIAINQLNMYRFIDFINIYSFELIKILSHYIHQFAYLYGAVLIIIGLLFFYISRKLKQTTIYDKNIAYIYLLFSIVLFLLTTILMYEVYGWFSLLYCLLFIVFVFYVLNRKALNIKMRKMHFMFLILLYFLAYFITQNVVYDNLSEERVTPLDLMSINFYLIVMTLLATISLVNYVFLKRTLATNSNRINRDSDWNKKIQESTNHTFEKINNSSLKIDEKIMLYYQKTKQRIKDKIDLQEEDIPNWMRKPKWFKVFHVEILCSGLILILSLIELNNRNVLFSASKINVVKMQYFYEWINLIGFIAVIIAYLYFTLLIHLKHRGYFGQLFTISFIMIKVLTGIYLMIFKGINLSLFIPPILLLIFVLVVPIYFIHIRKRY